MSQQPDTAPGRLDRALASLRKRGPTTARHRHPETEQSFSQSQKITVSLFPVDNDRITAIQGALAKRKWRVSASQIVRLALRSIPIDDAGKITDKAGEALLEMLISMNDEDGRSRRFSGENLPADSVPSGTKRHVAQGAIRPKQGVS
jgi:hypothetical protein